MNTRIAAAVAALATLQAVAIASLDDLEPELFEPGTLLVAAGDAVTAFAPDGAALPQPVTGLHSAVDLCFAPDGALLVSDDVAEAVIRRDAAGTYLGCLAAGAALSDPAGLALGAGGELFVASRGTDTIVVFDAGGAFARDFGAGELELPWGLAVDAAGRLHAASSGAGEVVVFDPSGSVVDAIGAGLLDDPRGLAFGRDGRLYVASHGADEIVVFDAYGALAGTLDGDGQLAGPLGLAFGPDGLLYVSQPGLAQVAVLDADGALVATLPGAGLGSAAGLAFAPQYSSATLKATLQRPGAPREKLKSKALLGLRPGALPVTLLPLDASDGLAEVLGSAGVFHGLSLPAGGDARAFAGLQAGPGAAQRGFAALQLDLKLDAADAPTDAAPGLRVRKAAGPLHVATPDGLLEGDLKGGKTLP
jgi:streptogramin lyase